MRFYDLKSDADYYPNSLVNGILLRPGQEIIPGYNSTERPIDPAFIEKWLNAEATLNSWIIYRHFDFENVQSEAKLSAAAKKRIDRRRASMYNWLVEYKCQNVIAGRFKHIASTFPNYLPQFAKNEFTKINEFLSSKLTLKKDLKALADYFGLNPNIDLKKLLKKNQSKNFDNPFNIHSPDLQFEYDYLMRYYKYLEEYLKDNCVFEQENNIFREEEISTIKNIYKDLIDLCNTLEIKYLVEEHDEGYSVSIISVANCRTSDDLKIKMLELSDKGFSNLVQNIPSTEINRYFVQISSEIKGLKKITGKGEAVDEFGNKYPCSTFTHAKFIGPWDYKFAFFKDISYLQSCPSNFIIAWQETIEEIARKVEDLRNNLQLISITQAKEVDRILDLKRCTSIAKFKLSNNEEFCDTDCHVPKEELLFFLFTNNKETKKNDPCWKCRLTTEWKSSDVYYLLFRLNKVFGISIARVDASEILNIKEKQFSRKAYDTFISQRLDSYLKKNDKNSELLDNQISALLKK